MIDVPYTPRQLRQLTITALFVALAAFLYFVENLIPKPLPFFRLGLANIPVMLLLYWGRYKTAVYVALLKVVVGGAVSFTLFTPGALLSVSGTLAALVVMLPMRRWGRCFSLYGVSVAGAVASNIAQLIVARYVLIQSGALFYLTSLLVALGMVTGMVVGFLAIKAAPRLEYINAALKNEDA